VRGWLNELRQPSWSRPPCVIAIALTAVLSKFDRLALGVFLPYFIYLCYGTWWVYRVWRLNAEHRAA